jgi:serine-type D-Ala-D-Ala carboxypeptidase/endopeptidase (penicillin-binding protein 4)
LQRISTLGRAQELPRKAVLQDRPHAKHLDMPNRFPRLFAIWIVALVLAGSVSVTGAPLRADIDRILKNADASTAIWGIHIADASTGQTLYSRNADIPLMPASVQKLLTTLGALEFLGPDYRYRTRLYFDGRVRGSVLEGDLIIRGSGDPTFGSRHMPGRDPLRDWARALAEMGVREIRGRIIGDDDVFDDQIYSEGWDIDYVMNQANIGLGVSIGGLSYNDNVVMLRMRSGRPGSAAVVEVMPSDYLRIDNEITTSPRTRGILVTPRRILGQEAVRLTGSVPRSYEGSVFMPVSNPTMFTAYSLARFLEEEGVAVSAELVDVDDLSNKPTYDDDPLFVHFSPPMSSILQLINKRSNNFYAEQVFRTFSYAGSAAGGERRLKEVMSRIGIQTSGVSIRDGSGLSRKDMVPASALGSVIGHMLRQPYADAFVASMPAAGEPSSTMRFRLGGAPVYAKTGSLEYVRALAGAARTQGGREVTFVVFANNYSVPAHRVVQAIDQIVVEVTRMRPG